MNYIKNYQKEIRDLKAEINFAINLSEIDSEKTNKILETSSKQLETIREYLRENPLINSNSKILV
jgi:uncharacterized protein YlaN (UPF0358 family)